MSHATVEKRAKQLPFVDESVDLDPRSNDPTRQFRLCIVAASILMSSRTAVRLFTVFVYSEKDCSRSCSIFWKFLSVHTDGFPSRSYSVHSSCSRKLRLHAHNSQDWYLSRKSEQRTSLVRVRLGASNLFQKRLRVHALLPTSTVLPL